MGMRDTVDTIVIGGSAGAFGVVRSLVAQLPPDLPAAVVICLHQAPGAASHAELVLSSAARMPVRTVQDGMEAEPGCIYLAPGDTHTMLGEDHFHLRRGAHENNFRPAIDPLFRSAAVYRGPRAVGLVLSGLMDDGAAGAHAMTRTGGTILVQSPETADFPEMPQSTLDAVPGAEPVDTADLATRLVQIAGTPCAPMPEVPWRIGLELKIAGMEANSMENERKLGTLSPYNCPHCNGVLWEIEDDSPVIRYRCHTGHAYSLKSLNEAQERMVDESLFNTLRAHRGRASVIRRMAQEAAQEKMRAFYESRAARIEEDAQRIEGIIGQRRRTPEGPGATHD